MEHGLKLAIKAVKTRYRLAKLLHLSPSAVLRWRRVPYKRILDVEQVTGVPREQLRPELFRSH